MSRPRDEADAIAETIQDIAEYYEISTAEAASRLRAQLFGAVPPFSNVERVWWWRLPLPLRWRQLWLWKRITNR